MKTLIAVSMLLLSSVSFAKSYEGYGIVTIQQNMTSREPDDIGRYKAEVLLGKPSCSASITASRPFSIPKGTRLKVDYIADEKEVWSDGDNIGSFPTNGHTNIVASYRLPDGYVVSIGAGCSTSGLFPKRGLPTLNELLDKVSGVFTIELQ